MKLSEYLADYIEHEYLKNPPTGAYDLQDIIQQGIEAYVSTENVTGVIVIADSPVSEVYI